MSTFANGPTGRRPVNTTYLVVGLVFLGLAGAWALRETGVMDRDGLAWLLPMILVVAGAAGLVATVAKGVARGRRSDEPAEPGVADEPLAYHGLDELGREDDPGR
jgi:hypothetical protein